MCETCSSIAAAATAAASASIADDSRIADRVFAIVAYTYAKVNDNHLEDKRTELYGK